MWAAAVAAIALVGLAVRPTLGEVKAALSRGDLRRARSVVDALREVDGATRPVLEAKDAVLMAEAARDTGDARLAKLDAVAARGGPQASDAAAAARATRLGAIDAMIAAGQPDDALIALQHDFGDGSQDDAEVAEARARAFDSEVTMCRDDGCRLIAVRRAAAAHGTPARTAAVAGARDRVAARLAARDPAPPVVNQVRAIEETAALADRVTVDASDDHELAQQASAARDWADARLAAVPLVGEGRDVVAALMPTFAADASRADLDGAIAYFRFDTAGTCRGVYVVGPEGDRRLHSATWPAERILSQTIGHTALVRAATTGKTATTWTERGIAVTARWRDDHLVELRIGDARP